ncbi:hypothetical protein AVEN_242154-1 [Araneus ventricosus]|uniref:Ig-like domain-containing protein n=1 Tax=Araneus ventricosus TaxID=182803 RepID=A0A4Y2DG50_ARAVE|nr:hypothetical protein AVEN_242154-1 [Araneus ventricosus]
MTVRPETGSDTERKIAPITRGSCDDPSNKRVRQDRRELTYTASNLYICGNPLKGTEREDLLCLKLREIKVPAVVIRGEPVWLNCTYDLGNETLYSIKWHKNNVEFYRYLPEDRPPGQKYELAGIHLDLSKTDRGNIFMPYTDVDSEGIYRCEVSTEAPNFQTVKAEREMRIYGKN